MRMSTRSEFKTLMNDWDKTARLMASLERFQTLLSTQEVANEDVSLVMHVALENIDPEFDIREGSAITLRAIREALVAGAKATWEIIKKIFQYLEALYVRFTGSIKKVRSNQERVNRRLGRLGSKTAYDNTLSVSGIQRLSVDGRFVGADTTSLKEINVLTNYILNVYPKSIVQISRKATRSFLNILDHADGSNNSELAQAIVNSFADIYRVDFKEPVSSRDLKNTEFNGDTDAVKTSDVLVGNKAFVYSNPNKIVNEVKQSRDPATIINESLIMKFTELQLNVTDKSEREIELPTVRELTALTDEISKILTLAEKAESGRRDFKSVKTVVDDTIRQVAEIAESNKDTSQLTNLVMLITGELSKKLAEPMDNFTHWLAITLNVWLNFISHCIDHYETSGV